MKIILINYPYKGYNIGEIVDLGEEKNKSLVSLKRAVYAEEDSKSKKAVKKTAPSPAKETSQDKKSSPSEKKFLGNRLRKKVQERKGELERATSAESFSEPKKATPTDETPINESGPKGERQFLQNNLGDQVQERQSTSRKKSFWDNLK